MNANTQVLYGIKIINSFYDAIILTMIQAKIKNPKSQAEDEIVSSLLTNTKKQYTEAAHAEIFSRLITTIKVFNDKTEKLEKVMLYLAGAQVVLAGAQILLALN